RQALGQARRNAMGCARMPLGEQATCWQAVSQWTQEESRYFHALAPLFQEGAYATPAAQAARFLTWLRVGPLPVRTARKPAPPHPATSRWTTIKMS
ncbi:lipoprotein, putative, partial [Acidithiobacillus sp. GGI-221]